MATYEIILRNEALEAEKPSKAVAGSKASTDSQNKEKKTLSEGQKALGKSLVALQKVKSWINPVISHEINMVELRTGRREYARKIQFGYEIAQQGLGIVESIAMGYAVGNVWGAVIGAVGGIGHTAMNYIQRQDEINTQQSLENISLQENRIRAGAGGSRRI